MPTLTFDIANYEPSNVPGYIKHVGNKTFREVKTTVEAHLRTIGMNTYEWCVAGEMIPDNKDEPIPEYDGLILCTGAGNNQGWRTQVAGVKGDVLFNILNFEHFEGLEFAFKLAHELARFLGE